jgi:hypothetical protein
VLGVGEGGAGGVVEGAGEGEVGVAASEVVEDELEGLEGAVEPGVRGGVWVCEELEAELGADACGVAEGEREGAHGQYMTLT